MKTTDPLIFYVLLLATTPILSGANLYSNYRNNIYPTDQDIIALPLLAITATCIASLLLLLLQLPYRKKKLNGTSPTALTTFLSLLPTAFTSVLLVGHILYWSNPNHLLTAGAFMATFCFYVYYQLQLYGNRFQDKQRPMR